MVLLSSTQYTFGRALYEHKQTNPKRSERLDSIATSKPISMKNKPRSLAICIIDEGWYQTNERKKTANRSTASRNHDDHDDDDHLWLLLLKIDCGWSNLGRPLVVCMFKIWIPMGFNNAEQSTSSIFGRIRLLCAPFQCGYFKIYSRASGVRVCLLFL